MQFTLLFSLRQDGRLHVFLFFAARGPCNLTDS